MDLTDLLASWELHLRAERKSAQTVKSYGDGVRAYIRFCDEHDRPQSIDRTTLRLMMDVMLTEGAKPATATSRHLAVRRFSAWLTEEGEQDTDPLLGLKAPKLDQPVVEPLSDADLRALIKACKGPAMRDRRDEAIIRLMFTTGARAGEVVGMQTTDLDLRENPPNAIIRRGKGGRGRSVPLAVEVAAALDRYLRARKSHRLASEPALWLGDRGKTFTYDALHKTLRGRADAAGVEGFHPHRLRHTAAHRWLSRGGSEGGLMAVAGWTRPEMLLRYTRAQSAARAAAEAERLNLGDI
ncbi:tyrosine-type recombinase/integrase [Naumannella halotolerans]|uniref:Site-specific recombinase XerD n=1 Tax=Naumannella halotolerans TaxID=993414 RepID=A0A4R7J3G3_9ACTN|nr:tyrosine-type recombinase/integrase [Naumannella halotolerans]TDT30879.1 site-specific recombinase XerD [Naumannella halotolerans]